jgi:hypothetical protein
MSTSRSAFAVSVLSILAACAAQPPARTALKTVPPLDPGASRVVIGAGVLNRGEAQAAALSSVRQVGPVYVDGRYAGDVAQNEYFVIDVKPGTHSVSCSPLEPVRNLPEQKRVDFEPGETKTLVCDMATARGELADKYSSRTYVEERTIDLQQGAVVGYTRK